MDAREISNRLAEQVEDVCRLLLPNGKRTGAEWTTGDSEGNPGKSCRVRLTGPKAGVWSDFSTDESGDLLDLWASARSVTLADAIRQAKDYLGIREPDFEPMGGKVYVRPKKPSCEKPKDAVLEYLSTDRRLSAEAIAAYRVAATKDGKAIVLPFIRAGGLLNVKYLSLERPEGKKVIRTEKDAEPCLFGWQAIPDGAREVTICEGEMDALSLWQYGRPALSVPIGANNHQWIEHEYANLERFSDIYLCFDLDDAGEKGVAEVAQRLGRHRCRVVALPCKDANECLQKGVGKADIDTAFAKAEPTDPEELKALERFSAEAWREFSDDPAQGGAHLPWRKSWDSVRLRPAELTIWTGISGHGKSQCLGHVVLELLRQSERACIASLEIKPRKLVYRLVRQAGCQIKPTETYFGTIMRWFTGKAWLFDVTGSTKSDRILEVFVYARRRYGIRHFIIDSLMKCGIGEDDYRAQKAFVEALCDFKNEYECHVHLVAHSRKKEDSRKQVDKMDVKGTGAITDLADNVFSVWRNKRKEEESAKPTPNEKTMQEPDTIIFCDKQRNGEWEGSIRLWWDNDSFQLVEQAKARPYEYVAVGT